MEENTQKPIENPNFDENGKFKEGNEVGKLGGRPKGALDFKTKFENFITKLAENNKLTPEEVDEQLFAVAYKKAKEGDYAFYRDIHDRLYGKPVQKNETDLTSGGKPITWNEQKTYLGNETLN